MWKILNYTLSIHNLINVTAYRINTFKYLITCWVCGVSSFQYKVSLLSLLFLSSFANNDYLHYCSLCLTWSTEVVLDQIYWIYNHSLRNHRILTFQRFESVLILNKIAQNVSKVQLGNWMAPISVTKALSIIWMLQLVDVELILTTSL